MAVSWREALSWCHNQASASSQMVSGDWVDVKTALPQPQNPIWAWHFTLPEHQGLSHVGLTPRLHICPPTPDPMGKGPLLCQLWQPAQLGPGRPLLPLMPHPTSNPTSTTSARAWRPSSSSPLAFLRVLKGLKSPSHLLSTAH